LDTVDHTRPRAVTLALARLSMLKSSSLPGMAGVKL
jgi:hypothetical protein